MLSFILKEYWFSVLRPVQNLIFSYRCQFPVSKATEGTPALSVGFLDIGASLLASTAFHYTMFFRALQSASDHLMDLGESELRQ